MLAHESLPAASKMTTGSLASLRTKCQSSGRLSYCAPAEEVACDEHDGVGHSLHVYLIDARQERAMLGGRLKLNVSAFMSVREVKSCLSHLLSIPVSRQRLFYRSRELTDHRTLEESGVHSSGSTLVFDVRPGEDEEDVPTTDLEPVACPSLHADGVLPPDLESAVAKARVALFVGGKSPELAMDGTGGTYFLRSQDGRHVACFKPADEEPFCVNNPRHFVGPHGSGDLMSSSTALSMRRGVRPGKAYVREVAAYLLDREGGRLAGVPETTVVECRHPKFRYADRVVRDKVGSLQVFVPHDGVAEDYGVERLEVERLQAIAALDIRALNCDRNAANLLIPKEKSSYDHDDHEMRTTREARRRHFEVVPIDHGLCLPEVLEIEWFDWCWIDWPQLAAPVCDAVKRAIAEIDPKRDSAMLRDALELSHKSLRLARAASELLKRGVAAGLTLRDVASLVVAPQHDDFLFGGSHQSNSPSYSPDSVAATQSYPPPKSRLAAAVDRANELASLALDEDRHPGRRRSRQYARRGAGAAAAAEGILEDDDYELREETACSDECGRKEVEEDDEVVNVIYSVYASDTKLQFSISDREEDDEVDLVARAREEKNVSELELRFSEQVSLSKPPSSMPVPISTWTTQGGAEGVTGSSPRWVDGLPAQVASKAQRRGFSSLPAEGSDDGGNGKGDRPRRRSTERTPLVRLHSCPALADAVPTSELEAETQDDDDSSSSSRRLTDLRSPADEAEFDRHFFHFLCGILDDLVMWKRLAVTRDREDAPGRKMLASF